MPGRRTRTTKSRSIRHSRPTLICRGDFVLPNGWRLKLPVKLWSYDVARYRDSVLDRPGLTLRYWFAPVEPRTTPLEKIDELRAAFRHQRIDYDHRAKATSWGWTYAFFSDERRRVRGGRRGTVYCFYAWSITANEFCHFQGYADRQEDLKLAVRAWKTLTPPQPHSKRRK